MTSAQCCDSSSDIDYLLTAPIPYSAFAANIINSPPSQGTSELQRLAERVSWRNASSTIDHQRDMLRVWIQQPECTLFTRPPFHEQLNAYHLQHRRELAVHMRFHHASLIRTFDRGRLTALLRQHYLSVEGSHGQLAERLIAFQEFVLYAVFNGRDARQYLRNHCK